MGLLPDLHGCSKYHNKVGHMKCLVSQCIKVTFMLYYSLLRVASCVRNVQTLIKNANHHLSPQSYFLFFSDPLEESLSMVAIALKNVFHK